MVEILYSEVPAAVGCGLESSALNVGREEIEVIEERGETSFTHDGTLVFF